MVIDKVLPEKFLIGWRAADGELFPTANTGELVVFEPFFYRGFSLPTNKFFQGLLHPYIAARGEAYVAGIGNHRDVGKDLL